MNQQYNKPKINSQLLCTFVNKFNQDKMLEDISNRYTIKASRIYLMSSSDDSWFLSYNVLKDDRYYNDSIGIGPIPNTISIHRKHQTNTFFTINALNELVKSINNGILDEYYDIDWSNYSNTFLKYIDGHLTTPTIEVEDVIRVIQLQ